MNERLLRRGDIVLVDFEPARVNKKRPSVVITNNQANLHGTSVVVVPLSSNVSTVYPFQSHLPLERTNLDYDSKAQVELLRSVSVARVGQQLGQVPPDLMLELDEKLRLHLGL